MSQVWREVLTVAADVLLLVTVHASALLAGIEMSRLSPTWVLYALAAAALYFVLWSGREETLAASVVITFGLALIHPVPALLAAAVGVVANALAR